MPHFKLVIGREAVDTETRMAVLNPATEAVVDFCPVAGVEHLEAALAAAKRALPAWSRSSLDTRRALIRSIADGIEARIESLAALLTSEQGKPLAQARLELQKSCAILRYFAQADLPIRTFRHSEVERIYERRAPLGI
ncbi:MAG TPA: aldehyde dehydrogenase family protein, partial [Steroidobacter sp.]|nr:aldehyde dehydrogenase family protein [Steroidobacter sp.]